MVKRVPQRKKLVETYKKGNVLRKTHPLFRTPDENRTHIVGTGIRYSIH